MAWVTKNSTEEYKPEAPAREYTKKEKAANWWHYQKWAVLAGIVAVIAVAAILKDIFFRTRPDYEIAYVSMQQLPVDTSEALQAVLAEFGEDLNGDGQVVVQLNQYTVDFNAEETNPDAYYQMAGVTQLSADLSDGNSYIFLLEDPAAFERVSEALQYLDGTTPDAAAKTDWEKMVYRWADCPVLAGLDLGSYTGMTLMDDQTGDSQEVLADLYVARRVARDEKQAEKFTGDEALWQALTAGAGK